jgi:hypothetical protein
VLAVKRPHILLFAVAALPLPALAASCGGATNGGAPADSGTVDTSLQETGEASTPEASADTGRVGDAGTDATDAPVEAYAVPGSNFAFHHYYLGDTDRQGTTSASAWSQFGRDVDGKTTTASSTDVCTLVAGASKQVQVDGTGGIDNSWGANIMPIFETLDSTFSTQLNQYVAAGTFTSMVDVVGLTSDPMQTGAAPGWGFVGASFPGTPTWTPADNWPVFPNWVNDGGLPSGSTIAFPGGAIASGAWQSGTPTDFPILLVFGLESIELVIHDATVSFNHATPTTAAFGTLSGILYTQEFEQQLAAALSYLASSLCAGSALDSIEQQITQTQDIVHDGTNSAGQPCDAISLGIGFDGVQIGPVQSLSQPHVPLQSNCPDAGGGD